MSLSSALASPATAFRRFLDPHLVAGSWGVRGDYRLRLPRTGWLAVGQDIGREAGAVGQAVDHRLRLAFTCAEPVDTATLAGIEYCRRRYPVSEHPRRWWRAIAEAGLEVVAAIGDRAVALALDDRSTPLDRDPGEEEYLARLFLLAAWFEVMFRAGEVGFVGTPIHREATGKGGLAGLLAVVPPPLVAEVVALVRLSARGPLLGLRTATEAARCFAGPVFDGSAQIGGADGDVLVDGMLIDFKCLRDPWVIDLKAMQQLLGYVLLDYSDARHISVVAVYQCRAAALVEWSLPQYLQLLGVDTDLAQLRAACAQLCDQVDAYDVPWDREHQQAVEAALAAVGAFPGDLCRACRQRSVPGGGVGSRRIHCCGRCRDAAHRSARRAFMYPDAVVPRRWLR